MKALLFVVLSLGLSVQAHEVTADYKTKPILADLRDLNALGIPVVAADPLSEVGYAVITPEMEGQIQERAHLVGKCGGFESLASSEQSLLANPIEELQKLTNEVRRVQMYENAPFMLQVVPKDERIVLALNELSEDYLRESVVWLSSFPNRYEGSSAPNIHVDKMKARIEKLLTNASFPYTVSLIDHKQTKQKSIRVHIEGSTKPNEIIVLGGHLDSINQSWIGKDKAPGADDNASGSSNLLDVLRVVATKNQPQRSVEFFWYAGEEAGLLGSAEISKEYKVQKKEVIAVLQLDMTLFPGSGELVLGSMTDFTSPWLREYLKAINTSYLNIQVTEDKCGYGCSDHASWFRNGYPTLMPFESLMSGINRRIHSKNDIITPEMSFKHSMEFSKIALIFAMDLANSNNKQLF